MAEDRKFKTVGDFIQHSDTLLEEEYATELRKFSAIERANILATEYINKMDYPAGKFNRENIKTSIILGKKEYYPIAGWDPDVLSPYAGSELKISPIRKWLNKLPKKRLHNPRENKTYILYG